MGHTLKIQMLWLIVPQYVLSLDWYILQNFRVILKVYVIFTRFFPIFIENRTPGYVLEYGKVYSITSCFPLHLVIGGVSDPLDLLLILFAVHL